MPIDVKMPQLGESVTEGTIGRWLKQAGDQVTEFEPLLEVTTDKVDTEIPATINGTLTEILVPEGETVRVGTVIARLVPVTEQVQNGQGPDRTDASGERPSESVRAASVVQDVATRGERVSNGAPISPVVARLAAEHRLDLAQIRGTGLGGRVTKKDVETFLMQRGAEGQGNAATAPAPRATSVVEQEVVLDPATVVDPVMKPAPSIAPPGGELSTTDAQRLQLVGNAEAVDTDIAAAATLGADDELLPLSPMRRAIARNMVHSRQTASHVTTVMEVDLSRVVAHRTQVMADYGREGVKLTYTPYFVEAASTALRAVPIVNASFVENGILQHRRINIGVAVAIPDGLIVPVIKDADEKSLMGLARAVNDLAERARMRRLLPGDTQDGTFTITNHGVGGSLFATPIINQPQAAILGVGAITKRVVVIGDGDGEALAIRPMCYLSLSFDHRLVDGATGDAFLMALKQTLESPWA